MRPNYFILASINLILKTKIEHTFSLVLSYCNIAVFYLIFRRFVFYYAFRSPATSELVLLQVVSTDPTTCAFSPIICSIRSTSLFCGCGGWPSPSSPSWDLSTELPESVYLTSPGINQLLMLALNYQLLDFFC